jgi:hypothetical protein
LAVEPRPPSPDPLLPVERVLLLPVLLLPPDTREVADRSALEPPALLLPLVEAIWVSPPLPPLTPELIDPPASVLPPALPALDVML